jgi:uroporphyrinogen-III synthase
MHILSTRPDTGEADPVAAGLAAAGHQVTSAPLMRVVHCGGLPALNGVQALIFTSRNGLKAVAPLSDAALALPLYAVGPATAAMARELGVKDVVEGPGTARELLEIIEGSADKDAGPLLHIAGETLACDLSAALATRGFTARTETVYRTEPVEALDPMVADAYRHGAFDGVVLMSPKTASVYAALVQHANLGPLALRMAHFCLSDAVAQKLEPLGAVRVAVACLPNSQEMLALIAREASESS